MCSELLNYCCRLNCHPWKGKGGIGVRRTGGSPCMSKAPSVPPFLSGAPGGASPLGTGSGVSSDVGNSSQCFFGAPRGGSNSIASSPLLARSSGGTGAVVRGDSSC
eukprot:TRINITY_DN15956_c1_g1_i6.p1 TRINITY_DN15956_c1_g1~~TRINITY_DN15956_c1_g1_i6.p1  ORF type:complete len:106 (-),score=12.77 TRINITY_DN15956_c1_g1_i6:196-513(-)